MKMLFASPALFALLGFVSAAEGDAAATPPAAGTQAAQEELPIGSQVQTSGKVTSVHSCPMVGVKDPHTIVKLETDLGDTDIVDLGSTAELKANGIEPKDGQRYWVDGRFGKINDKFLIVAEHVSEGKLVLIDHTNDLTSETVKHAQARGASGVSAAPDTVAAPGTGAVPASLTTKTEAIDPGTQLQTVSGSVIHTRRVQFEGEPDLHVLAKIQTANGVAVVDLGTCTAMPSTVNITDGQQLTATGYVGQLNGKPIIVADTAGNLSTIQRPVERDATPTQVR